MNNFLQAAGRAAGAVIGMYVAYRLVAYIESQSR